MLSPQRRLEILSSQEFAGHNYLDLNFQALMSPRSVIEFDSAANPLDATLFVSADGTIHLYGNSVEQALDLLYKRFPGGEIADKTVFAAKRLFENLKSQPAPWEIKLEFTYYLHEASRQEVENVVSTEDPMSYHLVELGSDQVDQTFLDSWYSELNQEMEAAWEVPDLRTTQQRFFKLASDSGEVVGAYCNSMVSERRYWFGLFYIWPRHRQRGMAHYLLRLLIERATNKGLTPALLVETKNRPAISLYRKMNFCEVDTIVVAKMQ